ATTRTRLVPRTTRGPFASGSFRPAASPQIPANSAPQRSQYHSVGRLSVPHSPHLSVLATPGAPGLAAAGASAARPAPELPGLLPRRAAAGAGFRSSSATDLRNASS